jgi:YidC/Oxa1 family membrane protein insertase
VAALFDLLFSGMAQLVAFLYQLSGSYGLAIIGLTIVVRLILFPLTAKQVRSMQAMAAAAPEMRKLQEMYKDDRQKLNTEMMTFYRQNKINPAAGCLPLLLQAPFLFALYNVIYGLTRVDQLNWLMIQMPRPKYLDHTSELYRSLVNSGGRMVSFGVDLSRAAAGFQGSLGQRVPYYVLVVLVAVTGIAQQVQMMRKSPPTTEQAAQMQRIMKFLPLLFAVFAYNVKAGVVLYWIAGNIWTMAQTAFLYRKSAPKPVITGLDGEVVVPPTPAQAAAAAAVAAPGQKSMMATLKAAREVGKAREAEAKAAQGKAAKITKGATGGKAAVAATGTKSTEKQVIRRTDGGKPPSVASKATSNPQSGKPQSGKKNPGKKG